MGEGTDSNNVNCKGRWHSSRVSSIARALYKIRFRLCGSLVSLMIYFDAMQMLFALISIGPCESLVFASVLSAMRCDRNWKESPQPGQYLQIVVLILLSQNPMSDVEVKHHQTTVWLELPV